MNPAAGEHRHCAARSSEVEGDLWSAGENIVPSLPHMGLWRGIASCIALWCPCAEAGTALQAASSANGRRVLDDADFPSMGGPGAAPYAPGPSAAAFAGRAAPRPEDFPALPGLQSPHPGTRGVHVLGRCSSEGKGCCRDVQSSKAEGEREGEGAGQDPCRPDRQAGRRPSDQLRPACSPQRRCVFMQLSVRAPCNGAQRSMALCTCSDGIDGPSSRH